MPLPPAAEQARTALARGDAATALRLLKPLLARYPKDSEIAHLNGAILLELGQNDQARYFAERAIALADAGRHHSLLGDVHMRAGRDDLARASFEKALARDPDLGLPRLRLALLAQFAGRFAEAEAHFREGIRRRPEVAELVASFAQLLVDTGRGTEAMELLETSLAKRGTDPDLIQAAASLSNYLPGVSAERSSELHFQLGISMSRGSPPPVARGPWPSDRPVRVAFVSPDLRDHSVARFVEPILRAYSRAKFAYLCYSSGSSDAVSLKLKSMCAVWRDVRAVPADQLVAQARADKVDIAIDLAGNTVGNRLDAFARRLAPLQATYLGYPHSTGLSAMDARLVDVLTDPPGCEEVERIRERRVRIEGCFLCYQPAEAALAIPVSGGPSPVSFGSFNVLSKVQPEVIRVWARILRAVPEAPLVLKARSLSDASVAERYRGLLAAEGVDPARLHALGPIGDPAGHFAAYSHVGIALDPFPYNGTTTTCEALLMGVPVVALSGGVGSGHASRVGASLLTAVGAEGLIAGSPEEYVDLVVSLAHDRPRLAGLRAGLRDSLLSSPLCDASGFATRFAAALKAAWELPTN